MNDIKDKLLSYLVVIVLIVGLSAGMYRMGDTAEEDVQLEDEDTVDDKEGHNGYDHPIDTSKVSYEPLPESVDDVVDGNNEFAFDLYHELDSGENLFYSPWSISTALAMTYEGARGKTREEIGNVFGYPSNATELRKTYGYLHDGYNTNKSRYNLSTANSLWVQENFPILDEYRWLLLNYYFARAENVDFINERERTCERINRWVRNNTNGKIDELVTPGMVDEMTRLILANAIYFKGLWEEPFNENLTMDSTFHTYSGDDVTVPFMYQEGYFNYTITDEFQILQKKYVGNDTSMLFILPNDGDLDDVEDSITYKDLRIWRDKLKKTDLKDVLIPKFNMSTEYKLTDRLSDMGMPTAFTPNEADFSGIDGRKDLFIQFVKHKAFVKIDEKGTEAAAATAVGFKTVSLDQRPSFIADHPFLFIIQDDSTGNILFMGRVNDPSSEG